MDNNNKKKYALNILNLYEKQFGFKAPERLIKFWETNEIFNYNGKCLANDVQMSGYSQGTFRLSATIPNWEILCYLGGLDEAISGADGEWEFSRFYIPIFECDESVFIVCRADDPACSVGVYMEGTFRSTKSNFRDGVMIIENSMDQFLEKLIQVEKANFEIPIDNPKWDSMAKAMG